MLSVAVIGPYDLFLGVHLFEMRVTQIVPFVLNMPHVCLYFRLPQVQSVYGVSPPTLGRPAFLSNEFTIEIFRILIFHESSDSDGVIYIYIHN